MRGSMPTASLILLDDQDRSPWNRKLIAEGLALIDKAMRHRQQRALPDAGGDRGAACARGKPEDTDWKQIDLLYGALELAAALAGRHAQPRGRGLQGARAGGGAGDDRAAWRRGLPIISISSACAARFLMQLGRDEEARVAFDRAIALANTSAEAAHIRMHLDRLMRDSKKSGAKISKK